MTRKNLSRRQVAGMIRNRCLRMSPAEARVRLGADRPSSGPPSLYDDSPDAEDEEYARNLEECPAFDDMNGD